MKKKDYKMKKQEQKEQKHPFAEPTYEEMKKARERAIDAHLTYLEMHRELTLNRNELIELADDTVDALSEYIEVLFATLHYRDDLIEELLNTLGNMQGADTIKAPTGARTEEEVMGVVIPFPSNKKRLPS